MKCTLKFGWLVISGGKFIPLSRENPSCEGEITSWESILVDLGSVTLHLN